MVDKFYKPSDYFRKAEKMPSPREIFEKEQKDRKKKFWDLFSFGQEVDTDFEHKRSSISKIQQLEIHRRVSIINNLASTRRFTTRA